MKLNVKFEENNYSFKTKFGEIHNISDGGFENGYAEGYENGKAEGYTKGYTDGLASRTFEIWTITLIDGTVIEKEVALL